MIPAAAKASMPAVLLIEEKALLFELGDGCSHTATLGLLLRLRTFCQVPACGRSTTGPVWRAGRAVRVELLGTAAC